MNRKRAVFLSGIFLLFLALTSVNFTSAAPGNNPIFATIEFVEDKMHELTHIIQQNTERSQNNQTDLEFLKERASALEHDVATLSARLAEFEVNPTPTQEPILFDDFSGSSLNTEIWEVFLNNGSYTFSDGFLVISGGEVSGIPFIRTIEDPFSGLEKFEVEFGIQYTTLHSAGSGLTLSINQQPNVTPGWDNNPISYWQDSSVGLRFLNHGNTVRALGVNDAGYHVVKIVYDGDNYLGYVDGVLEYTSNSLPIAGGLWFGHPNYDPPLTWTGFKLDYIKITAN